MLNKSLTLITSLFAFVCLAGLSGCASTSPTASANYTSKYHKYTQVSDLPKDYPTQQLPDGNLWGDFRHHMQLPLALDNRQVQYQIRWYQTHQDFLNRSLTRGAQYFYYIFQQTKQRNLPAELALLPVFESGYVPIGRSNKGAVGLWQFMPRTAANFRIRMNKWYDGRRDVVNSTDAALRYLTYLYYYFDRNWLLAIAAYNWGEGSVQNAVLRNQRRGYRADYWALSMPQETRAYIPQLLALAAIIKNPGKYGISLVPINNGPYFAQIDVGRQMNLDKAAKMAGVSDWSMRMLNAGLLRGVTEPDGPYTILLPRNRVLAFKDKLAGRATTLALAGDQSTQSTVNSSSKMDQGQEQEAVSARPSLAVTKQSGQGQDIDMIVPVPSSLQPENTARMLAFTKAVAAEHKSLVQDKPQPAVDDIDDSLVANVFSSDDEDADAATKTNKKFTKKRNVTTPSTKQYVVGRGETLFSIARQYDTSVTTLRRMNKLKNNNIKPGRVLIIPMQQRLLAMSSNAVEQVEDDDIVEVINSANRVDKGISKQSAKRNKTVKIHASKSAKNAIAIITKSAKQSKVTKNVTTKSNSVMQKKSSKSIASKKVSKKSNKHV